MRNLFRMAAAAVAAGWFAQAAQAADADKIRVACVGDSITYGAGVKDRATNSYPAVLGRLLGEKYQVVNYGVSGATLLNKGDKPYIKQKAFDNAKELKPHIVIIKLGTNDSKPQNWKFKDEFSADCKALIQAFATLESKPKIYLCKPVPAYPGNWGIDDARIRTEAIPLIEQVAKDAGCKVIDLYAALGDKPALFPDKVHPNADGARLIAETVFQAIR